jgi:hypothetical protein
LRWTVIFEEGKDVRRGLIKVSALILQTIKIRLKM